jgi:hypothetical protein
VGGIFNYNQEVTEGRAIQFFELRLPVCEVRFTLYVTLFL